MTVEKSQNELTTTLHLNLREVISSPVNHVDEQLALLSEEDRVVVTEIQNSGGTKALLLITRGSHKGSRFLVTTDGVSIGRSADSDIFLDDVTVSRTHATVLKIGNDFQLKDSGSLNGTYVNNRAIDAHTLVSGDEFQIGKFHLLFVGSNK